MVGIYFAKEQLWTELKDHKGLFFTFNNSEYITKGAKVAKISDFELYLSIAEGKFHQVKRMFLARDNKVLYLKRIKIGDVWLDKLLEKGQYREMTQQEKDSIITDKGERLQ